MPSGRTILRKLRTLDEELRGLSTAQQTALFEKLVAESLAKLLYLPFYSESEDDPSMSHRVVWYGTGEPLAKSPAGKADAIAHCCDYSLVVEATLNTGATQCRREFAQCFRHSDDFRIATGAEPRDVYTLLVCTDIHVDTCTSIMGNPRPEEVRIIPLQVSNLSQILETSVLAFTMKHIDFRMLLVDILDQFRHSRGASSVEHLPDTISACTEKWRIGVLNSEKSAFLGLKSYEAMKKIGRRFIGTSEILDRLERHTIVKQYLNMVKDRLSSGTIEKSLVEQSLACRLALASDGEELLEAVPSADFKGRSDRVVDMVVKER